MHSSRYLAASALLAALAGCGLLATRPEGPAPVEQRRPDLKLSTEPVPLPPGGVARPRAHWIPAAWGELPGWGVDRLSEWLPALRAGCVAPPEPWQPLCSQLAALKGPDDATLRRFLEDRLVVYRVESPDANPEGLLTGYFEPLVAASRKPTASRRVPLHAVPAELGQKKPWYTRQQIETPGAAAVALKGREIAYVEDPLDALVLQIQGSGRLRLTEPDGSEKLVRVAFAGHNDQPYKSVGRWLIEQGELKAGEASWPGIKDWARRNPRRVQELLWQNPRYVFFREEPLPDPSLGPKGAQGVPLTPGRSIAVDPQSIPYGTPVWIDSTEPLSTRPLQRLVMAQDTGSAIVGAVRADFFWGWGDEPEAQAGRTKQALRVWALWPRP
ncbi:murein transglycosylase A [Ideonella alba]|uniref:peptidoglycan lytic exotransglycosylase n=1 Tax=Ideonella alba TaxID=2824118 RepID=A0A941BFI5_9BURK|nr:MltA domain-containing protein [Ideonella alba]MBQ0932116.1 MltA domain-containing protein [Ideonella alba]